MSGSAKNHGNLQGSSSFLRPDSLRAPSAPQGGSRITALHIEFVAKPNEAHKVHSVLPSALHGALEGVAGFAGSFVMVSNYEARLVTVVTLWAGEDRARRCEENVRWVRALVAPYLDRCLRVQTLATFLPPATAPVQDLQSCSVLESADFARGQEMSALVA